MGDCWDMLAWFERFDVDMEGKVGSKMPAVPECFREWPPGRLELRLREDDAFRS